MTRKRLTADGGSIFSEALDMNSPLTAEKFRSAALIYTNKSNKSKKSAIETLKREQFLTKTGRIARVYSDF